MSRTVTDLSDILALLTENLHHCDACGGLCLRTDSSLLTMKKVLS
ncbi:hypothetical protein [Nostoc sp. 'Peltigera membranacea cyanobiont' 210A]|nr:hypothetical protein [Nostoc sp. 'Peltigera membranacea cyanobiont' 210A]